MKAALAFVAGLGVGAGAAWLALRSPVPASSPVESPSAPPPTAARTAPAAPPAAAPVPPEAACDPARVAELALRSEVLEAQLAHLGGLRIEWPADVPPALRPEAVQALVDTWVPTLPIAETVELDCDEYPCIGYFRYAEGAASSSAVMQPLSDAFRDASGGLGAPRVKVTRTDHGTGAVVAFGPKDPDADSLVSPRIEVRMEEMWESLGPTGP